MPNYWKYTHNPNDTVDHTLIPGKFKPGVEIIDFTTYDKEAKLFDSIACEFTEMAGFKVYYYVHQPDNVDLLYGEDPLEGYDGPYETKIAYQPEKESSIANAFGFAYDDTVIQAEIPKTMFTQAVSGAFVNNGHVTPKPKDVIRTLWNGKLYEITEVTSENKVFIGNKLIWTLAMKPYRVGEASDSAEAMLYTLPTSADMPIINRTNDIGPIKNFGDNELIQTLSDELSDGADIDSIVYGYGMSTAPLSGSSSIGTGII